MPCSMGCCVYCCIDPCLPQRCQGSCLELKVGACGAGGYDAAMQTLLRDWDWDAILPCHGDAVASGGKGLLRRHLGRS